MIISENISENISESISENVSDLDVSKVFGNIGIVAGASTPKNVIDEVFKAVNL